VPPLSRLVEPVLYLAALLIAIGILLRALPKQEQGAMALRLVLLLVGVPALSALAGGAVGSVLPVSHGLTRGALGFGVAGVFAGLTVWMYQLTHNPNVRPDWRKSPMPKSAALIFAVPAYPAALGSLAIPFRENREQFAFAVLIPLGAAFVGMLVSVLVWYLLRPRTA